MIAIIDYNAGNIRSVMKAFNYLGEEAICTRDHDVIRGASHVVLPGVGSFEYALSELKRYALDEVILEVIDLKTPFLGICLGLQLLFAGSDESPGVKGLSILDGFVKKIPADKGNKIPHIGWSSIDLRGDGRLFSGVDDGSFMYFVHSYYVDSYDTDIVKATCDYGVDVHASIERDNVFACQFHPEKSGSVGLRILKNFAEITYAH